jgi:hypothetical protein
MTAAMIATSFHRLSTISGGNLMRERTQQLADDKQYTIAHFVEIARQNRFAENATTSHDSDRCLVCHPERSDEPPFLLYLEVIRESVKVRRPHLDDDLVAAINSDLELLGVSDRVTLEALRRGRPEAIGHWRDFLRDALDTGLGRGRVVGIDRARPARPHAPSDTSSDISVAVFTTTVGKF